MQMRAGSKDGKRYRGGGAGGGEICISFLAKSFQACQANQKVAPSNGLFGRRWLT